MRERAQAFHAADSALIRCSRMLSAASPSPGAEPARWRLKASFEGPAAAAITPFAEWPYAYRAPQCLIESWAQADQAGSTSYLITARGFGASPESEAWLQLRIDIVDGAGSQHWRRVVARPF
jgi:hypothetical protein